MPLLLRKGRFLWLLAMVFMASCQKELSCEDCNGNGATAATDHLLQMLVPIKPSVCLLMALILMAVTQLIG
jgi:hypothetical protein